MLPARSSNHSFSPCSSRAEPHPLRPAPPSPNPNPSSPKTSNPAPAAPFIAHFAMSGERSTEVIGYQITQALRNMLSSSCANCAADRRAARHHIHERPSPSARAHTRRWERSALLSELSRRPARTARQLSLQYERTDPHPGETRTARRCSLRGMEGDAWV